MVIIKGFIKIGYFTLLLSILLFIFGCKEENSIKGKDKSAVSFMSNSESSKDGKDIKVDCGLKTSKFYPIKTLIDGDTFWLEDGCDGVKVRLIGIDAPESRNMFGKIKEEPYGKEASAFMEQFVSGKMIKVEFDVDSLDQYGRTLAYCFTDDGIFLNKKMVEEGMAMISTVQPNIKYQEELYNAQVKAREGKKGLWGL